MPFDPEEFRQRYPGRPLPDLRFQSDRQRWETARRLAERFRVTPAFAGGNALWDRFDDATRIDPADGSWRTLETIDLASLLADHDIEPTPAVFVDWYIGDQARLPLDDLAASFPAFREPGFDDVAIFDDSYDWILFVTHDGRLLLCRADEPGGENEAVPSGVE